MMTYDRKKSKIMFFKIVWPCWGYVWASSLVILRPSKNWKFFKIWFFSKVVYWPLGYYLASSLSIFSPEINNFEKSIFFDKCVFAYSCLFYCIFRQITLKNVWKSRKKEYISYMRGPLLKDPKEPGAKRLVGLWFVELFLQ